MRLQRIALRSFRGVHDREVRPAASGVTVLEGANEVGKTSTVLALDLLVDQLDSSTARAVKACQPAGVDTGPEVEADIATGPYRFTYRKRWLRRKLTELTVHAPRPEQLTGREAHARVLEILDETMDRALWKALRVEQHTPVGQVELGGHAALSRALDRAAGGDPGALGTDAAAADDLVARVETDLRRYRTPSGRATGELRAAEVRLDAARAARDTAAAAVAAVEADAVEHERLDARLRGLAAEHAAHQGAVAALEEQWAATESRRDEAGSARRHAEVAAERLGAALDRRDAREAAVGAVAEASRRAATTADALAGHARRHDALREHAGARRAERDAARDAHTAAATDAAAADAVLTAAHDHAALAGLTARLRRVGEAEAGMRAEDRALAAVGVTDADAERLEALALDIVRAQAARDAGAAVLEVHGEVEVELDGQSVRGPRSVTVTRPVSLRTPDGVEVRVRPGRDAGALADAARDAEDALAAACTALGVADAAHARRLREQAREAARRRDDHRGALDRELDGEQPDDLRAEHAALLERAADDTDYTDDAVDLPAARRAAAAARTAAEGAAHDAGIADAAWRAADDAVRDADTDAALRGRDAADARHALDRAAADLDAARARTTDAELDADAEHHRLEARRASAEHERLAALLAGDDPESLELRVAAARRVDDRLRADTLAHERARAEATGRLRLAGSEGRHDRLAAAEGELAAAEAEHAATARRDRAATLLHATLVRHRDDVRRAYVAPFRREVERLARIVFGPSVTLEVDDALHLVARTLDGVTVPFEALSAGAKEQLGLCARLAGAALVDPDDGVPVVIDDALGHSDPERLARLGAVFTAATSGAGHQVLVLTSTPERYRGVGGAHVVRLAASPAPRPAAPATPAADDEPEHWTATG